MDARSPGVVYTPASGPAAEQASKTAFLVEFQRTATIGDVTAILDTVGGVIVAGPIGGSLYRIAVDPAAAEAALQTLRASQNVKQALPQS
jgi:pantoate kinase